MDELLGIYNIINCNIWVKFINFVDIKQAEKICIKYYIYSLS